jgi:hypothetical protein
VKCHQRQRKSWTCAASGIQAQLFLARVKLYSFTHKMEEVVKPSAAEKNYAGLS